MVDRGKNAYLNIFVIFSFLIFLSFQGYHFYLVQQTENYLKDFGRVQSGRAFDDFKKTCLEHELFASLFKSPGKRDLVWSYFRKELSRIERSFYLESILVIDEGNNPLVWSESGAVYSGQVFDSDALQPIGSHKWTMVPLSKTHPELKGTVCIAFTLPFSDLLSIQKNYLQAGFFLFLALFSAGILLFRQLLDRIFSLQQRYDQSKRLAEFGALAGGVAHDIRNPLSIIKLQLQSLQEMHAGDRETEDFLENISRAVKRVNHTISTLMVFQKENLAFDNEIRFPALIEDMSKGDRFGNHDIILDMAPTILKGNQDLLYRLFENLLKNSSEAIEDGSGEIRILGERNALGYRIDIIDNGVGMESTEKIFDPFFTTKNYGTGLGLLVVKDAVERHGAEISCKSTVGKGTRFTIQFPSILFSE